MRTKALLQELIGLVDEYDATVPENEDLTISSFIIFLNQLNVQADDNQLNVNISKNLSLLHRYSKFYVKKLLKDSSLQTVDEYSYLICLYHHDKSFTKTELNNMNAMEKTSGNEVIRRLLKSGLVKQQQDKSDKRSLLISITQEGKNEINKIFPGLHKTAVILSGKLLPGEKAALDKSLSSLCDFHQRIFAEQKNDSIDEILKKS
ncbi:MAG TPA: MarR family winged helix-turn-helix transcriptional regulator [Bacteroidales bacterium]|nr:MarR family winged helix-turn-helix transcriptional regulator [Bacteroidales bacterium]